MGPLCNDPLFPWNLNRALGSHISPPLSIDGASGISLIPDDLCHHGGSPEVFFCNMLPWPWSTLALFIAHRRQIPLIVENLRDLPGSLSIACHSKNLRDRLPGNGIDDQVFWPVWILSVAKRRCRSQKVSLPCQTVLGIPYFFGQLFAVEVIEDRGKGNSQAVRILRTGAVVSIAQRDETHPQERKYPADAVSNRKIVPSETAEILDDDAMDTPFSYQGQQFLYAGPVKGCSAPSVVEQLDAVPAVKLRMRVQVMVQKVTLIDNAVGFALLRFGNVFLGKSKILCNCLYPETPPFSVPFSGDARVSAMA